MRTTIEIPDDLRARLLELAARRGEKGFSRLVQEAVARYLDDETRRGEAVARAREVVGSLTPEDADALERATGELRARWR